MRPAVALERPPRRIAALLDETAANLLAAANAIDGLSTPAAGELEALARCAAEQRRIGRDLRLHVRRSWRAGPDRARLVATAEAAEGVVEALEALAWDWKRCPLAAGAPLLGAVRDTVRAGARGIRVCDDPALLLERIALCEQRERELRRGLREARRALLAERDEPRVGLCASRLLHLGDAGLRTCVRLRAALQLRALA
jgi:hypothetical protein